MHPENPEESYRNRIAMNEVHAAHWAFFDSRISDARMYTFIAIFVVGAIGHFADAFHLAWAALPLVGFVALVAWHVKVINRLRDARDTIAFYETGLDRILDRWVGKGDTGEVWKPENHPYAHDLDLFGSGSLFQLMNTTRTKAGASTLATWMNQPASPDTIAARQTAVSELRNNLDLRERVALTGREIQSELHPIRLTNWAEAPTLVPTSFQRWVPRVFASVSIVLFTSMFFFELVYTYPPFMLSVIVNLIVLRIYRACAEQVTSRIYTAVRDLKLFVHLAELFEQQTFESELLKKHQSRLVSGDQNASTAIRKLSNLLVWMELYKNQMFIPFSIMFLWVLHFVDCIEDWRAVHGKNIQSWMDSLGEIEALSALASYAYEHPADPFPEFIDEARPQLCAQDVKHPLLPAVNCVSNSVELDAAQSLLIVSGSNMSGKSTYLRTIGINVVLAMMGAPVRCTSIHLTPITIGASIQVQDSIQSGVSHFYAEILRLKTIIELGENNAPVLFLIDEILHGTNSHDRRSGTQGVVDELLDMHAIGLITTHDLALTQLDSRHAPRIKNIHFQDQISGDQLVFDYRVHEGIVQKSNALRLMRSIGLKIRTDGD